MCYTYECQVNGCGNKLSAKDTFSCPNITWEANGRKNHYEDLYCRECVEADDFKCFECGGIMEALKED